MSQVVDMAGIGCCSVDYLCVVPNPIEADAKMRIDRFSRQGGGLVATALVTAARLGASTRFLGKVSDDGFGTEIAEGLSVEGVETSAMVIQPGEMTRFAMIVVDVVGVGRHISVIGSSGVVSEGVVGNHGR